MIRANHFSTFIVRLIRPLETNMPTSHADMGLMLSDTSLDWELIIDFAESEIFAPSTVHIKAQVSSKTPPIFNTASIQRLWVASNHSPEAK